MKTLTDTQNKFLQDLGNTAMTLGELFEYHQITPHQFASWLCVKAFRQAMRRTTRRFIHQLELDLVTGATVATQVLRDTSMQKESELSTSRHRACVDLIKLARDRKARRKSDKRRRVPPAKQQRIDQLVARHDPMIAKHDLPCASFHQANNPEVLEALTKTLGTSGVNAPLDTPFDQTVDRER